VLPVAYVFGWLALSADLVRSQDVPNYYVGVLEGLMLIYLAAAVAVERRIKRRVRRRASRSTESLAILPEPGGST
jgi:ABC-type uncharacterized transport system permease subunit